MYLEESRAILHISVIADDLATYSLNLPTFTSTHPEGSYCLGSSSVGIIGIRGFQDPKCHLLAAVGIGTERLITFSAPADRTNIFHQCRPQVQDKGLKGTINATAEEQNSLTVSPSNRMTSQSGDFLVSTLTSSRYEKSSVFTLH